MLKYVISLLLVAFAWTAVLLLRLPEWLAGIVTVLVVGVLGTLFALRKLRARRAAQSLERALAAQGEAHAKIVRPEQEAEIRALQTEFLRAVGALKGSKLGKGGLEALYALPWYMIIGPPGAGKSTALRNSGLQFPYLSQAGGAIKGLGGTRNCDWWLTNEAILLDTAGRYTLEDDDREEWLSFLDLLKTHRPRMPLNGVLVAISVAEVVGGGEEQATRLGQRVRERVDEVMERLQMVVPVYLLFTKCDLVEGFAETFGNLAKAERGNIWGFTLKLDGDERPPGERFATHFDELFTSLQRRADKRIGQERRIDVREKIYGFPQQFSHLRGPLAQFVDVLCTKNVYKETPPLRGVYFTSGTQEGRPIDRVMGAMADAFGVAPRMTAPEVVTEAKSYFLRDVFHQVIFPDQNVASRSRGEVARVRNRGYAIGGTILGASLLISSLPAWSFVQNRALIRSTEQIVQTVAAHRASNKGQPISLDVLEPLRQRLDELHDYETTRPPPQLRFGLYKGSDLYPHVSALYAEALRTDLLGPILRRGVGELEAAATRQAQGTPPSGEEHARLYSLLEMYLLLTAPHAEGEPGPVGPLAAWLVDHLVDEWVAQLGATGDEVDEARLAVMRANVKLYVDLLATDPRLGFAREETLVRSARLALASAPGDDLVLSPLIESVSRDGYDLDLARVLGSKTGSIQGTGVVRGAFTRRGWEERVRAALDGLGGGGEAWVMGQTAGAGHVGKTDEQRAELRSRYFAMYIDEWQGFLRGLRVKEPTSPMDALTILQDLTRGVPAPFGRLMRELAYNARLEEEAAPAKGKASALLEASAAQAQKKLGKAGKLAGDAVASARAGGDDGRQLLGPEDVSRAFEGFYGFGVAPPSPPTAEGAPPPAPQEVLLDIYQAELDSLRDALMAYLENPEQTEPLVARLQAARTRVKGLIEMQDTTWRPRFEALLWPPIDGASVSTSTAVAAGKSLRWCNEVVSPFEKTLKGRYPFVKSGHDAALADLADFYRAGGLLWTFYDAELGGDIQRAGDRFEFAQRLGRKPAFSDSVVDFLTRSHEIASVLFPPGGKEPLVEFEIRIRPSPSFSSISVEVDGQVVNANNAPDRWFKLRWPGDGKGHGASIKAKGAKNRNEVLSQDGEWGLFRLFEAGVVEATPGSRVFSAKWFLGAGEVVLDVRPTRSEAPFFGTSGKAGALFQAFRAASVAPPRAIAKGAGCRVN